MPAVSKIMLDSIAKALKARSAIKKVPAWHKSSNIESLAEGFMPREYGTSFARSPQEAYSSPLIVNRGGTEGLVEAIINGRRINYNDPKVKRNIDKLSELLGPPYGTNETKFMRENGIDWVEDWQGIGKGNELHVLNPKAIKILRILERNK